MSKFAVGQRVRVVLEVQGLWPRCGWRGEVAELDKDGVRVRWAEAYDRFVEPGSLSWATDEMLVLDLSTPRAVEPPCAHSKAGSCTACMFEAQHREGYAVAEPVRKRKGAVAPAKWEDIPLDPPVGDWVSGKEHALVKAERDDLRVDLDRLIDGRWKPADLLQANADLRTHVARLERSLDLALKGRRR